MPQRQYATTESLRGTRRTTRDVQIGDPKMATNIRYQKTFPMVRYAERQNSAAARRRAATQAILTSIDDT